MTVFAEDLIAIFASIMPHDTNYSDKNIKESVGGYDSVFGLCNRFFYIQVFCFSEQLILLFLLRYLNLKLVFK